MKNSDYMLLRSGDLTCPLHINSELEFVYVKSGSVTVFYDTEAVEVTAGEAAMVIPFSIHRFEMNASTDAKVFMFSGSLFESFANIGYRPVKEGKFKVAKAVADFAEYIISKPNYLSADIRAVFYAFFSQADVQIPVRHTMSDDRKKVVDYIYQKISEPLNLESISCELGIGKKKISNIFKGSMGVGVSGFISNVRIEKAKVMLVTTDKTVIEIAFECGFGSVRTFNRIFAQKTGRTPLEFRKYVE